MKKTMLILLAVVSFFSCQKAPHNDDLFSLATDRIEDLRFSVYITAHSVQRYLSTEEGRREALSIMKCNGITKAYVEVYRSGLVIEPDLLAKVSEFFKQNGIGVTGGIATVPGGDFGVRQEAQLGWFNWQNPKTQADLKGVIEQSAPLFDEFIIDDFLCTGDTSAESRQAKGDQSWSKYRRDLLVDLSTKLFIEPAKRVNPDITMIIKYPQWYDRFHLFGYDPARESQLFDRVWVGTESRGQYTQRYGFVQPYEGFVNYRWLSSIAGEKCVGAWFDHGDCDDLDFIEQAYQSTLAGASEIVMFHFAAFINGHAGHHLLRVNFERLADLAKEIKVSPVQGVQAYKPPNSDAGGDLYIMDYMGMLGVPIVPESRFPENAASLFLPTQAAADENIVEKVMPLIDRGAVVVMTSGFLANAKDGERLAKLAGVSMKKISKTLSTKKIFDGDTQHVLPHPLDMEVSLKTINAETLLNAKIGTKKSAFFTKSKSANIYVLNSHTFSQKDFDAVGEVLLCPKQLGLLELPQSWANIIRSAFTKNQELELKAPTRVAMQPFGSHVMLHNYNKEKVSVKLAIEPSEIWDVHSGERFSKTDGEFVFDIEPRSRRLLKFKK
jgi:hypothetical protein